MSYLSLEHILHCFDLFHKRAFIPTVWRAFYGPSRAMRNANDRELLPLRLWPHLPTLPLGYLNQDLNQDLNLDPIIQVPSRRVKRDYVRYVRVSKGSAQRYRRKVPLPN